MYFLNCFFVYSILGFILEMLFGYAIGADAASGILYGPWTPIYGLASIFIIAISEKLFKNLHMPRWVETIIVFFVVTIVITLLEWLGGTLIELLFGFSFWDYSDYNYNLGKYMCLEMALVWGVMSIIFIYVIRPILDKFVQKFPKTLTIILTILFIIDIIAMVFCVVKISTNYNYLANHDMGLIYAAVLLITIIVFFKLLIDSDGSYVFLAEGLGLAAYLIILALILLLENIVAIGALAGAIIIVGIVAAILIFGNSSKEGAGSTSTSSGSGGSTSYKSSSGNVGVKSRKPDKNTANTPAYKKDSNPNHHYIANYNEILGVKLYKVHGDMGDYIELDNTMVEKKICSLADAESGKHKFYREESGKEIRVQEIPWK